jgi:hypothetical protein
MKRFSFAMSPAYSRRALPLPESPTLQDFWIMLPAVAIAAATFALVWSV